MSQPLSPAAQAVFDAWIHPARFPVDKAGKGARKALAAALRAAADQVEHHWDGMECVDHLQAIAAELKNHHG